MQRLTDADLSSMLTDLESDRIERKQSFSGDVPTKARQAICAFANDLPNHQKIGVLIIGVNDEGKTVGLNVTDELMINIANIKTDGKILPMPAMTVEKRSLNEHDVIVITVLPADAPPVKFDGRVWIRTGARRALANAQEERILNERRRFKNLPFDLHPMSPATIGDLSKSIFENDYLPQAFASDVLEANGRSYEERLSSCKMIVAPNDTTPTVTGLLAIGNSPQDYMAGARIQFLRINGTELADEVIDEADIGGCLLDMLRIADEKLKSHNRTAIDIVSNARHQSSTLYPQAAIQQILYNAVLHRTYEGTNAPVRIYWFNDRIEIHSPGGPYGNVTTQNFGQAGVTDYRNPTIATVLKTFGFVQQFGRGIATAKQQMQDNGNPEPKFDVNETAVVCTLRMKESI